MTVGVDVYTREVEYSPNKTATLSIWDVGGQERFEFLRTNFYYGTDGLLMVFDLTRDQTFRNVRRWLIEIRRLTGDNIPFVLVGNKADLLEEVGEVIDPEEAEAVAEMEDTLYIQTSAKTGLNVEQIFSEIVKKIIKSRTFSVDFYENLWKNIRKK